MPKWPKAPQDYDSFLLNSCHGKNSKNQKLKIYKKALELACKELAGLYKEYYGGDSDHKRICLINKAINIIRDEKFK